MTSTASRLCQACGLCCNGVLFHTVRVLPSDNSEELTSLGIRIQRKNKEPIFDQPCVAFKNQCCSIYMQRPTRCRLFECQQLKKVAADESTETEAFKLILAAQEKVSYIKKLLQGMGRFNSKKPLFKEVERFLADPLDEMASEESATPRGRLKEASQEFQEFLNKEFRIIPLNVSEKNS